MSAHLTEVQIEEYLKESKLVRAAYLSSFPFRRRPGHNKCEYVIETHSRVVHFRSRSDLRSRIRNEYSLSKDRV